MPASERQEALDMISRTFDELGGRATKEEMLPHLLSIQPEHFTSWFSEQAWNKLIGEFFRSRDADGLPVAPAVDEHGTHVQGELLSVEEFRYVVRYHMSASRASRRQAKKWAERCLNLHGVEIDVEDAPEVAS